jgi:hypothetical protein
MIYLFRHLAARIWFSLLLGGLASLWILPAIQSRIGLEWTLLPVAAIFGLVFLGIGWGLNHWGINSVKHLIGEAGSFERDGMHPEAKEAFHNAARVLDSFLISPFVKHKQSADLAARMARFYLARAQKSPDSEVFLVSYLHAHPEDEEVAENWLNQIETRGGLREEHQELAFRLGSVQPQNKKIQLALARFYLLLERTDFQALQTYRRVFEGEDRHLPPEFVDDLARLFLMERRADEWALRVYLEAVERGGERSELLKGIAACVRLTVPTEWNKSLLKRAHAYLQGLGEVELEAMSTGFKPPAPETTPAKRHLIMEIGSFLHDLKRAVIKGFVGGVAASIFRAIGQVQFLIQLIRHSRKIRRAAAAGVLAALAAGIALLLINTMGHLMKTDKTVSPKPEPAVMVVTDPFTIQVAAYLKPEYAYSLVTQLKKKGFDAYWTKAVSAEKKWYQVRVSHFPDKQSAREYGESLKTKGIIEDFYVANYRRP